MDLRRLIPSLSGPGVAATLTRGAGAALGVRVLSVFVNFAFHLVLARSVSLDSYGEYVYAFSWSMIAAFIGRSGMQIAVVRYTSRYVHACSWSMLRGLRTGSLVTVLLASTGVASIASACAWALGVTLDDGAGRAIYLAFFVSPLFSLLGVFEGLIRGLARPVSAIVADGVLRPFIAAFAVLAFTTLHRSPSAAETLAVTGLAALLALGYAVAALRQAWPDEARSVDRDISELRSWLLLGLMLLLMGGMSLVHSRADTIMLGILSDPSEVGLYAAASRFGQLMVVPLQAVNLVAAPMIARAHAAGASRDIQRIASTSAGLIAIVTIPIAVILLAFSSLILRLFGDQYAAGDAALEWIVIGQLINACSGSVAFLLTMTRHESSAALCTAAAAISNVCLNLVLVPRFGAQGAAASTACAVAIQNLGMLFVVRRLIGIDPTIYSFLRR